MEKKIEDYLRYEPETGKIFWVKIPKNARVKVGIEAGGEHRTKYRYVKVFGKVHASHRLVWRLYYGEWPPKKMDIDHINGNRSDNRIENLRLATDSENLFNSKINKRNKFGLKGVSRAGKKFRAQIRKDGERICLGVFETPEAASEAYKTAALRIAGEFARW